MGYLVAALLLAAVTGASASVQAPQMQITNIFTARRPRSTQDYAKSQALLALGVVYFNVQDLTTKLGYSCAFNTSLDPTLDQSYVCVAAETDTQFETQPVPAAGNSQHPQASAFSFSTGAVSTIVQWNASSGGAVKPWIFTTTHSVIAIAPVGPTLLAVRNKRRSFNGSQLDEINIYDTTASTWNILWDHRFTLPFGSIIPLEAHTRVVNMDGVLVFVDQNQTTAILQFVNTTGITATTTPLFSVVNPCGIAPTPGTNVGIAKVAYDSADSGEILNALLVFGNNATYPNQTIVCRMSHHTGQPKWIRVLSKVASAQVFNGGDNYIVYSGANAQGTGDWVGVIQAESGLFAWWTQERNMTDSTSQPIIKESTVFFQCGGTLCYRYIDQDFSNYGIVYNSSCPETPAATRSRIYCATRNKNIIAVSAETGGVLWRQPTDWAFAPQLLPNFDNIVATVTTSGSVVAVDQQAVLPPTTPMPGANPTPPGDDGDSGKAAVTALVVIIVLLVIAAAAGGAFFFYRRRRRTTQGGFAPINEEGGTTPAPTQTRDHSLYGSA
jgi:hypothetical protein